MAKLDDIGWGRYKTYEGPFYKGSFPFQLPASPTVDDRLLAVITACEGGHYDAINMYDRMILSSGLIQWAEAGQYSVSSMLGAVVEAYDENAVLVHLKPALDMAKAEFGKKDNGKWRFFFAGNRPREEIDTIDEQRMLFTHGSAELGTWTPDNRIWAKTWAACVASVWEDPMHQAVQRKYTASQLSKFVWPDAHQVFLHMNQDGAPSHIIEAAYAGYLSFAVNNPTIACRHLLKFESGEHGGVYTEKWLRGMLKELTHGPNISIYPARYKAIKPVLEQLYTVELDEGIRTSAITTREVQLILIELGYDLGPHGADGVYGRKTKDAVCAFQHASGIPATGAVDPNTVYELLEERSP
jgi:hypothetical protein